MLFAMAEAACDRYEIDIRRASPARRLFGPLLVLLVNLGFDGSTANPGGRTFVVRDKGTGQTVAKHRERMGDDMSSLLVSLEADLENTTVEEFDAIWVTPAQQ